MTDVTILKESEVELWEAVAHYENIQPTNPPYSSPAAGSNR